MSESSTPTKEAMTPEQFYSEIWIKFNGSDPRGDWPIRFAKQFAEHYAKHNHAALLESHKQLQEALKEVVFHHGAGCGSCNLILEEVLAKAKEITR